MRSFAGVLVVGAIAFAGTAEAEEATKIAVLPLEIAGDVPAGRAALEDAAAKGAAIAARPVVTAEEAAAALGGSACAEPSCWSKAAQALAAEHLLVGTVERRDGFFKARFRVVRRGLVLGTEESRCEEDECPVAELCRLTAREAVRKLIGTPEAKVSVAAPPEPAREPLAVHTAPPPPAPAPARAWHTLWPPVAVGVGVATMAAGALVILRHDDCVERYQPNPSSCLRFRGELWPGVVTTIAGAAVTGVGATFMIRQARAQVAVTPRGLSFASRF